MGDDQKMADEIKERVSSLKQGKHNWMRFSIETLVLDYKISDVPSDEKSVCAWDNNRRCQSFENLGDDLSSYLVADLRTGRVFIHLDIDIVPSAADTVHSALNKRETLYINQQSNRQAWIQDSFSPLLSCMYRLHQRRGNSKESESES